MEYFIIDVFSAIVEYFAIYAFLWIFYDRDPQRRHWRMVCHIIMPVLFFLFSGYVTNIYLRPFLFVGCAIFIAQGFRGNTGQRIFFVAVFQIILILLEIIISLSLQPMKDISFETFYFSGNIFARLVTLGVLILLFWCSQKKRVIFASLRLHYIFMLLLFSVMSLFFVLFSEYLLLLVDKPFLFPLLCLGVLLAVFTNICLYYLFYQLAVGETAKAKLQVINAHVSQQKEAQTQLEQTHQQVRKLHHDMKHYLIAIAGLLKQNQVVEAQMELEKQLQTIAHTRLFDTGYPVLNSVLAYKFEQAQSKNITPQLFWNINTPLQIHVVDLSVILANGLDNAIEAACQVTATQPFLSVYAELKSGYIKVHIINSTHIDPVIVNGTIATTKQDKTLHGLGLESIAALCRQYQGQSFIEYENHLFTLTVLLQNTAPIALKP